MSSCEKKQLKRTVQCAKCPWKKITNPFDIPDGYSEELHQGLEKTIATDNSFDFDAPMPVMACHHSEVTDEEFCVGWLYNQLGEGNNIRLRIKMMNYSNVKDIKIIGDQHGQFNDTLPKIKTR